MSSPPGRAELIARLRAIGEDPSGAGAADQKTAREASRLLRREYREHGAVSPPTDYVLGLYYWRRCLAFPSLAGSFSRNMAATLLAPIFLAGTAPLPAEALPVILPEARKRATRALRAALGDATAEQYGTAAGYWRRIAAVTPDGDPAATEVAEALAVSLVRLFDRTGNHAELDDVIAFCRSVLAHPPAGASMGMVRRQLALTIVLRCNRFGSADYRGEVAGAIELLKNSDLATGGPRARAGLLSTLSMIYSGLAEFTRMLADADEAVNLARQALDLAGRRNPYLPMFRMTLSGALTGRYNLGMEPRDLAEATSLATVGEVPVSDVRALARTGQQIMAAMTLATSAAENTITSALDQAIDFLRAAAPELPDTSPSKPALLQTLSMMLWHRSIAHHGTADLDAAIEVARSALAVEGESDPQWRAKVLMLLARLLTSRAEDTYESADIDAAVRAGQEALDLLPLEEQAAESIRSWALVLLQKYDFSDEATDFEEATRILRYLSDSLTTPVPTRTAATVNLAQALLRHSADRSQDDLDEAVRLLQGALSVPESDAARRARVEYLLASVLAKRFTQRSARGDAGEALVLLDRNLKTPEFSAAIRVEAAVLAADVEQGVGEAGWAGRASGRLAMAVELLPFAVGRTLHRADRQRFLGTWPSLAARAAALALADERTGETPEQRAARALGLLEAGRTVLLNQAYDTRADLNGVRDANPALVQRFLDLRGQLERDPFSDELEEQPHPEATGPQLLALEARAGDQRRAGLAFAEVIEQIRGLPGQSGFMRPPDLTELTAQAAHGPIVVLNVAERRGDAFLVTTAGVRALRLPDLTAVSAELYAQRFLQSLRECSADGMLRVLDWLWDTIARPVLDELGLNRTPTGQEPWPRLWWVAGGVLANMPLHAAGRYHGEPGTAHDGTGDRPAPAESVLDRVVSSYAPSVRTLSYLRERSARTAAQSGTCRRSLVVAMGQTPGARLRDLANAGPEAKFVAGILPQPMLLTHGAPGDSEPATRPAADPADQPTTARVLAELAQSRIAHFACHAEADATDPSRSGLRLLDAPLTVSALSAQDLDWVVLAFLSACSTALNRVHHLLDESIHVVSGFQLAGIPQVVGTFWEVEDFASLAVVQSFYARLETTGPDAPAAARALHEITRLLRDEVPDAPWIWAAHMHAGC